MPNDEEELTPDQIIAQGLAAAEAEQEAEATRLREEAEAAEQARQAAIPTSNDVIAHISLFQKSIAMIEKAVDEKGYDVDEKGMALIIQDMEKYTPDQLREWLAKGQEGFRPWINQALGEHEQLGKRRAVKGIAEASTGTGTSPGSTGTGNKEMAEVREIYGEKRVAGVFKELKEVNQGRNPSMKQLREALKRSRG